MDHTTDDDGPPVGRPTGKVMFVGAGPGAADLLTFRAADRLRQADVIVHDALVPLPLLDTVGPGVPRIPAPRDPAGGADPGETTGQLLARLAAEGRLVVRLKGGDPTVFARLAEELEPLRAAGIPVEFVPGITAALAAASAAGVPLTSRAAASSLTIVTGHEAGDKSEAFDFRRLAELPGTLSVYMGVEQVARWSRELLAAGKPGTTPVTIVSRCSWPDQRIATSTLEHCTDDFSRHGWQPPAVVIVGEAAHAQPARGPLAGRRVLVTRPPGQADEVAALVRAAGGECLHVPLIAIEPPESWQPLDDAIRRADRYDWIAFASGNAVRGFVDRLRAAGLDWRCLGSCRVAAIGPATRRELQAAGLVADLAPESFSSEGLLTAFADLPTGSRLLFVRADRGRDVLRRELSARGHVVDEVAAYRSVPLESLDGESLAAVDAAGVDWITVTSPVIAAAAARVFGARLGRWRVASLSPLTSAALERAGIHPTVEAEEATGPGLVAAIVGHAPAAGDAAPADSAQTAAS
jgi:uroporphyrinogen III methyltransferase/synthase